MVQDSRLIDRNTENKLFLGDRPMPVSGGLRMCAGASAIELFSTTQKSIISVSTSEAEYSAMADGLKETIFLRYCLNFHSSGQGRGAVFFTKPLHQGLFCAGSVLALRWLCLFHLKEGGDSRNATRPL